MLVLGFAVRPASAQRLLELQVRTSAGADALAAGAAGLFWNPAAITPFTGVLEALIVEVRGSSPTGLDGVALAGAYRLNPRTTLAAGYQHIGVDEIPRTEDSPQYEPGTIDIGEHVFATALAREFANGLRLGATIRFTRSAEIAGGDAVAEFGAGAVYRSSLPFSPALGASAGIDEDRGTNWTAGVDIAPPLDLGDWALRASFGTGSSARVHGLTHRIAAGIDWGDRITVSAGLAGEPDAAGRSWQPVAAVGVRLNRYNIGVLREELPNDFGAIHSLRFSVTFQRDDVTAPPVEPDRAPARRR